MSKKHPERAQRRRQVRAERHRGECKQRKAAERARKIGVPRKEHPPRTFEQEVSRMLRYTPGGTESVPIHVPGPPVEPPPDEVVEAFHGALDEVIGGAGELSITEVAWEPSESDRLDADTYVRLELRMFGQLAVVHGNIFPLARMKFPDLDELDLRVAEQVIAALRRDRTVAAAAVLLYALDELLLDCLLLDPPQVAVVLQRLGIPQELEDILEPLARELPEAERRAWDAARGEGRWHERIGEAVLHSTWWHLRGPLADFGEWIAAAAGDGWAPPWATEVVVQA